MLTRRYLAETRPQVIALGTSLIAALVVAPFGILQAPGHLPGWKPIGSVIVLGVIGTAAAYLLFFTIIAGAGAAYASLVTYLVPPVALAYGALFLDEGIGVAALVGLVLIFAGVALGTRRPRAAGTAASAVAPRLAAAPSEP